MLTLRTALWLLLFTCSLPALSQKLYVWCPEPVAVRGRAGFLEKQRVKVAFVDNRTLPEKSKIDCQADRLFADLQSAITAAYPSAAVDSLPGSAYYQKADTSTITIKVAVLAYQAGFGTDVAIGVGSTGNGISYGVIPRGEWNGLVTVDVQLFDNRPGRTGRHQKDLTAVTSKPNLLGYKTSKTCLQTSYEKVVQALLTFVDTSLID